MKKKIKFGIGCYGTILLLLSVVTQLSAMDFFLSPEEADQLRLSEKEWSRPPFKTRGLSNGPVITIKQPTISNSSTPTLETTSPLSLSIFFEKKNAPVDMTSLEVVAKKGFFSKSLTERLKPFISGTTLEAKDLKIPKGKFKIQINIADTQGSQTSMEYRLVVQR